MSANVSGVKHTRGFDVIKPLSVGVLVAIMLPLVLLPLASIFVFGTNNGLISFWNALVAPEAIFALKLSFATSFWATIFNVSLACLQRTFCRVTRFGDATRSS